MNTKYYFENSIIESVYPTIWHGYLSYKKILEDAILINISEIDDILVTICEMNFYISVFDNNIYLSLCRDQNYYIHDFEKHIKKIIQTIENKFKIYILEGLFDANEIKHNGYQYKFFINRINDDIILKKKTLNWESYENKKKVRKLNINDSMKKLKLDDI
jgi:hypothetical protein